MKLVTYRAHVESAARLGVLEGDLVIDVARLAAAQGLAAPDSMLGLIDEGPAGLKALRRLLDKQGGVYPMGVSTAFANVSLLAPIPRPRKNIFGIGLNYVEHVAESAQALDTAKELPKQPVIFSKPPTTVVLAVLFSAISAYFYLRVVRYMYMSEPQQEGAGPLRCSPGMLAALTLCLLGVIGLDLNAGAVIAGLETALERGADFIGLASGDFLLGNFEIL